MKKLLIILVCIFIFFEVNSEEEFQMKYYSGKEISMKKCSEYFNNGKIIHSYLSTDDRDKAFIENEKVIFFSHKNKVYELVVKTKKIKNEIFNRHEAIENMYCYFLDFDKEKE